jgi:hypothetical protein
VKISAGRKRLPGRDSASNAIRQLPGRTALEMSEREHQEVATIEAERNALEKKSQAEDARWAKEKDGLESFAPIQH